MGTLTVSQVSPHKRLLWFHDAWSADDYGQYLVLNGTRVFNEGVTSAVDRNVVNRTDTLPLQPSASECDRQCCMPITRSVFW